MHPEDRLTKISLVRRRSKTRLLSKDLSIADLLGVAVGSLCFHTWAKILDESDRRMLTGGCWSGTSRNKVQHSAGGNLQYFTSIDRDVWEHAELITYIPVFFLVT